ncbi:hypothetical protein AB4Z17_33205, partial [Paenibacillus sp. TAF43_2]|uniref:hypothetical protein n=1 Tax=Paenibacillus sp. TAF43_2 TaxID=3233069 RepID=UPI003F971A89
MKSRLAIAAAVVALSTPALMSSQAQAQEQGTGSPYEAPVSAVPTTSCTEYAEEHAPQGADWACVGNSLTITEGGGSKVTYTNVVTGLTEEVTNKSSVERADIAAAAQAAETTSGGQAETQTPGVAPRAIKDEYHASNSKEFIIWKIGDDKGATTFSYNISLHNHSGDVSMGYWETSGIPVELQYKLRIREDVNNGFDQDVFEYEHPDNYNPGYAAIYNTMYEPYWG